MLFNLNLRKNLKAQCPSCGAIASGGTSVHTGDIITGGKLETRCRRQDPDGLGMIDAETTVDASIIEEMDHFNEQVQLNRKEHPFFADSGVNDTFFFNMLPWLTPRL